jgi:hypothetical protein
MLFLVGCSSGNLDYVKDKAPEKWKTQGFEVVDYEGYQWGTGGINSYGGAKVWHRLKKIPDNGITYSGYIQRWGDELHVYGPDAIDAIKPNN